MTEMESFDNKAYLQDTEEKSSSVVNNNHDKEAEAGRSRTAVDNMTEDEVRAEKKGIMKNVILISFAFLLLFTAFQSMSSLQSSINRVCNLGTYSNAVIYGALVVSCMFLPSFLIKHLTVKWGLVACMFCYSFYIIMQFYPSFYTLMPGAVVVGIGAAPMWSAKCTYLTQVGNRYADLCKVDVEPIIVRFFGIFFLFFQSSSIWGPLISSAVFGKDKNSTIDYNLDTSHCGVNFCPAEGKCNETENATAASAEEDNFAVSKENLYIVASVYLVCSFLSAVIVAIFVDPLSRFGESQEREKKEKLSGFQLLIATFRHMLKPYQLLILPLTIWSGAEQGFFFSDFTAGFVTCAIGVHNLGYVFITYGVFDALCSLSFGAIIKYTGRLPIFLLGALINVVVIVVFFNWIPNPNEAPALFVLAALWGVADAVWQTQINALYGVLFENDEEAAFSNYRLWESVGFIISFILQTQVCVYTKLWVLVGIISAGMSGFATIEMLEWKKKRNINIRQDQN